MRYTAILTTPKGMREQKIFDVTGYPKELQGHVKKHPDIQAMRKIIDHQYGTGWAEGSQVIVTCNSDPKFKLELI